MDPITFIGGILAIIVAIGTIFGWTGKLVRWIYSKVKYEKRCQIQMSPTLDLIPPIMNGGQFQGQFACLQVRFGSDTDLELIDAVIVHGTTIIKNQTRDRRLDGGRNWNSIMFNSAGLPFLPNEAMQLKIRVADHNNNCCDLIHDLQMKQFPHPDYSGRNSGRWEIYTPGIFKISCAKKRPITRL